MIRVHTTDRRTGPPGLLFNKKSIKASMYTVDILNIADNICNKLEVTFLFDVMLCFF